MKKAIPIAVGIGIALAGIAAIAVQLPRQPQTSESKLQQKGESQAGEPSPTPSPEVVSSQEPQSKPTSKKAPEAEKQEKANRKWRELNDSADWTLVDSSRNTADGSDLQGSTYIAENSYKESNDYKGFQIMQKHTTSGIDAAFGDPHNNVDWEGIGLIQVDCSRRKFSYDSLAMYDKKSKQATLLSPPDLNSKIFPIKGLDGKITLDTFDGWFLLDNRENSVAFALAQFYCPKILSNTVTQESSNRSDFNGVEQTGSSSSTGSMGLTRGVSTLTAREAKARINVRSKPTINARSPHYGLPGDKVTVIECVQDQDTAGSDLNWCNVEFVQSKATGWIRSDFIIFADGGN